MPQQTYTSMIVVLVQYMFFPAAKSKPMLGAAACTREYLTRSCLNEILVTHIITYADPK